MYSGDFFFILFCVFVCVCVWMKWKKKFLSIFLCEVELNQMIWFLSPFFCRHFGCSYFWLQFAYSAVFASFKFVWNFCQNVATIESKFNEMYKENLWYNAFDKCRLATMCWFTNLMKVGVMEVFHVSKNELNRNEPMNVSHIVV